MAEVYDKGQVVLPKRMREAYKMFPGTKIVFKMEKDGILVQPEEDLINEMHSLQKEMATMDFGQAMAEIKKSRKKMEKGFANVPGR